MGAKLNLSCACSCDSFNKRPLDSKSIVLQGRLLASFFGNCTNRSELVKKSMSPSLMYPAAFICSIAIDPSNSRRHDCEVSRLIASETGPPSSQTTKKAELSSGRALARECSSVALWILHQYPAKTKRSSRHSPIFPEVN